MTRRALMQELGVDELKEWLAFERIYPFEDGYWQAALVAFMVARTAGNKKVKFEDLLPSRGKPKVRRQSGPEMLAIVKRTVASAERRNR